MKMFLKEKESVNAIYFHVLYKNVLYMLFHFSLHSPKTNQQKCVKIS